jgi:hypothetical protein
MTMTPEQIKEAVAIGKELAHSSEYESVRRLHPHIPAWEDLTHDQRARIRDENRHYWKEMRELGDKFVRGEI